jgi:hypothetical protein
MQVGGSVFNYANREPHVTYYKGPVKYDVPRRTVYLPVVRNARYELFDLFDHPDPSTPDGDRDETTVAPQAMLLMNAPLVLEAAERLAGPIASEQGVAVTEQIRRLHRQLGLADPDEETIGAAERFLQRVNGAIGETHDAKRRLQVWQAYVQTLLVGNEFLTVE